MLSFLEPMIRDCSFAEYKKNIQERYPSDGSGPSLPEMDQALDFANEYLEQKVPGLRHSFAGYSNLHFWLMMMLSLFIAEQDKTDLPANIIIEKQLEHIPNEDVQAIFDYLIFESYIDAEMGFSSKARELDLSLMMS